jgi:hypothetical protein
MGMRRGSLDVKPKADIRVRIVGRRMKASEQEGAVSSDGLAPGGRFRSGT